MKVFTINICSEPGSRGVTNLTKVTPELMQRLTRDEKKPQRRKPAREKREPVSPLPTDKRIQKDDQHNPAITSVTGGPARDPFLPSFQAPFGGLYGPPVQSVGDVKKELAPVYQAIEESENIAQKLHNEGDHELEKVKEMARELKDKQYRAPSHGPPCSSERAACVDCYKENHKNPLLCAKLVQAFVGCSRHAQEYEAVLYSK